MPCWPQRGRVDRAERRVRLPARQTRARRMRTSGTAGATGVQARARYRRGVVLGEPSLAAQDRALAVIRPGPEESAGTASAGCQTVASPILDPESTDVKCLKLLAH